MLIQEIKKLQLKKELVSVRRGCADEDQTGIFEFVNEEVVILSLYTDEGKFDGYTFFFIGQIYELMWGNREHKAIASLIDKHAEKPKFRLESEKFIGLLKEAFAKYDSVCIYHADDEESFDIGEVEGLSDGWLKLHAYGPKRTLSRLYKLLEIENITRITVDSPYQNNIVRLHNEQL